MNIIYGTCVLDVCFKCVCLYVCQIAVVFFGGEQVAPTVTKATLELSFFRNLRFGQMFTNTDMCFILTLTAAGSSSAQLLPSWWAGVVHASLVPSRCANTR